jgi:hypothetical protein
MYEKRQYKSIIMKQSETYSGCTLVLGSRLGIGTVPIHCCNWSKDSHRCLCHTSDRPHTDHIEDGIGHLWSSSPEHTLLHRNIKHYIISKQNVYCR